MFWIILFLSATVAKAEVVVLGAGTAGIATARVLNEAGVDFSIQTGGGVIGGRLGAIIWEGFPIQPGPFRLQGTVRSEVTNEMVENPMYNQAVQHGLRMMPTNFDNSVTYNYKGEKSVVGPREQYTFWCEYFQGMMDAIDMGLAACSVDDTDSCPEDIWTYSWRKAWDEVGYTAEGVSSTAAEDFYQWLQFDICFGGPPETINFRISFDDIINCIGNNFAVFDERGFAHVVREEVKVFEDRIVETGVHKKVDYSGELDPRVIITTSTGVYYADQVALSYPLAIYQKDVVEFIPPLPEAQLDFFNKFTDVPYNKCFMRFRTVFWDNNREYIYFMGDGDRGENILIMNYNYYVPDSNILLMEASAASAVGKTDEERLAAAMDALRTIYGPDIPNPVASWKSKVDDSGTGSYASWPPDFSPQDHIDMCKDIDGKIFFSGGHCSRLFKSPAGAQSRGEIVAADILAAIPPPTEPPTEGCAYVEGSFFGDVLETFENVLDVMECCEFCDANSNCFVWSFVTPSSQQSNRGNGCVLHGQNISISRGLRRGWVRAAFDANGQPTDDFPEFLAGAETEGTGNGGGALAGNQAESIPGSDKSESRTIPE